jgi:decaprenylphospho-beta-D-ribofuranose 2-oxidase
MADPPEKPKVLPGIPLRLEKLDTYMGLDEAEAWVYHPKHEEHVRRIFEFARQSKEERDTRVTFRGGAHSFDSQSLGRDIVISMAAFDSIEVLSNTRMRVGPGASWGAIVEELEPLGLMPKVTVTGSRATAGGTLSGDCLSRFSPAYGKEGEQIESFELLQLNGALLTCKRPPPGKPRDQWSLSERAFYGVISGLGYLGAVMSITYRVQSLIKKSGPIGIKTSATVRTGFKDIVEDLVEEMRAMYQTPANPTDESLRDAIYATIYVDPQGGAPSGIVWKSTITQETERRPLVLNQPDSKLRLLAEWGMRTQWGCRVGWKWLCNKLAKENDFIDDLYGFTFVMDGNARAKRIGKRFGFKMQGIQQSFVVPNDPDDQLDEQGNPKWDTGKNRLVKFFEAAYVRFEQAHLSPTLVDVLFLPEDDRFLLSATEARSGFVVSFAFETSDADRLETIEQAFKDLSDDLWADFAKGRVYLVKNVHVNEGMLATMYGQNAEDFFELKKVMDPQCLLRNDFLDRTFSELLQCPDSAAPVAVPATQDVPVGQEAGS